MVSSKEKNSIYDIRISTVAPADISTKYGFQELSAIDLAMKLHYIRFIYYFRIPAFDGFTIIKIKETMCDWLNYASIPCGRFRRTDSGQPILKCNAAGVRIIEASCYLSLDEWLESKDDSRHKLLVPSNIIGPELSYSPLVMIQLTKFKCGATSVGMGWSHVLGDVFSAIGFIRLWTQVIAGHYPDQPIIMAQPIIMTQPQNEVINIRSPNPNPNPISELLSVKRVGPVGDLWSTSSNSKMETFSIYISMNELARFQTKICQDKAGLQIPEFECICVMIWHCLGKIRQGLGPQVVTVCESDLRNQTKGIITNKNQTINVIKLDIPIVECTLMQLGSLMMNRVVDERNKIEEAMKIDDMLSDFLMYGVNLTFINLSDVLFYDIEVRGQKPVYVNCFMDNIDDKGVVLILPTPKGCSDGRIVSITLQENEMVNLKKALKNDWCIS
ncbi:protein ECERIFERUM 26-like [Lactuca sativa]|uniref:Uncharacterized protein n=1 Tax=Lactuca sativa TaxID=4236 RepID=A0A9R1XVZ4_LACSA|nr:protein ECERIFERUM 26-like [Lactuca sativa]KAJ0228186.1 hypothetical protein LSAT_V11C100028580 [Lactuca sativa]